MRRINVKFQCKAKDIHTALDNAFAPEPRPEDGGGQVPGCPECGEDNLAESGSCWDCTATDYIEEEKR